MSVLSMLRRGVFLTQPSNWLRGGSSGGEGFVCNMVNWILGMLFRLLVADQRDVWSEGMARN